jgi:hypothetical protein
MSQGQQWEPEPGAPAYAPPKSGAVTAVGVINLVLGGLTVICGLIFMFAAAWIFGAGKTVEGEFQKAIVKAGGQPVEVEAAGGLAGLLAGAAVVIGVIFVLIAVLQILAGVGVLNRRQWGRIITLVLGAIAGIFALLSLLSIGANPLNALLGVLIYGGYCVFVYIVLLNAQNAAEFR